MLLAFGINQMLMVKYELPRLPLVYLTIGAVAPWVPGQIAVFWPARRAAAVPPAVATRRVQLQPLSCVAGEGRGRGCEAKSALFPNLCPFTPLPGEGYTTT